MRHYALIPAKKDSSRLPNKNWIPFANGHNLVTNLISIIPDNFFDKIILSTDKTDLNAIEGVDIHLRDKSLSTKDSPVNDLIEVIIEEYGLEGDSYIWLLNPTSPLRNVEDFNNIKDLLSNESTESVISVSELNSFVWKDSEPLFKMDYPRINSQDAKTSYSVENGQFFVFKVDGFAKTKTWYSKSPIPYKQKGIRGFIDIDFEQDFKDGQKLMTENNVETLSTETLLIEHIVKEPIKEHTSMLYNHFNRYGTAVSKLAISDKDVVIDASCGCGYGSFILSAHAKKVFGLDISDENLNKGKDLFNKENIEFFNYEEFDSLCGNEIPKADKVISIETFEHIPKSESSKFINRLLSYLKPAGHMFLTVPLGENAPSTYNKYHLNEPSLDYLKDTFSPLFKEAIFDINTFTNSFGYETEYCHVMLMFLKEKLID